MSTTAHTTSGDTNYGVPATLTSTPVRGYLMHIMYDESIEVSAGWFYIEPAGTIARRKVGGRNTYRFTTQGRLIGFFANPKAN